MQLSATLLCWSWVACTIMRMFYKDSESMLPYLWIDTVQASLMFTLCCMRPSRWAPVVTASLYIQVLIHLVFWCGRNRVFGWDWPYLSDFNYTLLLNVFYAIQLFALGITALAVSVDRWWRWYIHPAIKQLTAPLAVSI